MYDPLKYMVKQFMVNHFGTYRLAIYQYTTAAILLYYAFEKP